MFLVLAALAVALAPSQDVAAWQERARELGFRGDHDRELIARLEAVAAGAGEQERRELARLARWREGLLVTVRHPAADELTAISISADGSRLATAGTEARVWDAHTGRAVGAPIPLTGDAAVIALDPTGERLAVIERWRRLSVWNVESGERLLGPLEGEGGEFQAMAWGPAGRVLATGTDRREVGATVSVWNVETGALRFRTAPFAGDVYDLEVSPDGRFVAADGAGLVWRVSDGKPVADLVQGGPREVRALEFHPREPWLAVAFFDALRTWDLEAGAWRDSPGFSAGSPWDIAFDEANDRWVVAWGHSVCASDRKDGRPAGQPLLPDDLVDYRGSAGFIPFALSHDGDRYARAGLGGTVRVWNTRSGTRLAPVFHHGAAVELLAFGRGDRLVTASRNGVTRVWSTESVHEEPAAFDDRATTVRFAPDGRHGLLLRKHGAVVVLDPSGPPLELAGSFPPLYALAIAGRGSRLAGSGSDHRIWAWDLVTGGMLGEPLLEEEQPWNLALDADGANLAVNNVFCVRTWRVDEQQVLEQAEGAGQADLAFDAAGTLWLGEGASIMRLEGITRHIDAWVDWPEKASLTLAADAGGYIEERDGEVHWVDWHGRRSRIDVLVTEPVESWLACAGRVVALHERTASLLDPAAGLLVARLEHGERIDRARAAGDRLVTFGAKHLVLWSLVDGTERARWACDAEVVDALPVPGSDRVARSSMVHSIVAFDTISGARAGDPWVLPAAPDHVTFADARTALVATATGAVVALDLASGERRTLLDRAGPEVIHVELSPTGTRLVRVDHHGNVELHDLERRRILFQKRLCLSSSDWLDWGHPPPITFDPTGTTLLVAANVGRSVRHGMSTRVPTTPLFVDAASGAVRVSLEGSGGNVTRAAFDHDGQGLVTASWFDELATWDTGTGEKLASFALGEAIRGLHVHPDEPLVVALGEKGGFGVWEFDTGRARIAPGSTPFRYGSSSPDGRRFYGVGKLGIGRIVDLRTGHVLAQFPAGAGLSAFGPDDRVLLHGGDLARLGADGLVPIASRRSIPTSSQLFNGGGGRTFLLDDTHAVVGARPSADGAVPIVLDFGPARDAPLVGDVDELREKWARRLGLEVARDGAIVDRR